jgi:hypothetical protein
MCVKWSWTNLIHHLRKRVKPQFSEFGETATPNQGASSHIGQTQLLPWILEQRA